MPDVDGIVTAGGIQGDRPLRLVQQHHPKHGGITDIDMNTRVERQLATALPPREIASTFAAIRQALA